MPAIQWSSFIADDEGRFDFLRAGHVVSILLALVAGAVLVGVMTGLLHPPTDALLIGVSALVLPITGGQIAGQLVSRAVPSSITAVTVTPPDRPAP